MFKKIFKFLAGYVIIEIVGKNKERFLNICLENELAIWDVSPSEQGFVLSIKNSDFKKIRKAVRKCRIRVKIKKKCGRSEIFKRYKSRYGLLAAGVLACIYFIFVPQYIWCVEIEGAKSSDTENIERILREKGVYVGAKKSGIADLGEIKNAIVFGEKEVNWAWLYTEGAKARLLVQERTPPPAVDDKTTPTDIIAACDGYVRYSHIERGERRVNSGDTVSQGQILVSGKVAVFHEGYEEKYSYVRSRAEITADTLRSETGVFSCNETLRIRTGNKKKRISVQALGKEFYMGGRAEEIYENSDLETKNYDACLPGVGYIGLGISVNTAHEVQEITHTLSEEEVLSRAKENLREKIAKKLGINAVMTDEEFTYSKNGDTYTAKLSMRLRENIGIEIPCKE